MPQSDTDLRPRDVLRRFDRAASRFEDFDFVHRHAFAGLLERLQPMTIDVGRILDLGCGTGASSRALAKTFRGSRVTGVDVSGRMLAEARRRRSRFARVAEVRADARRLPFRAGAFDLVVANMLLPWIDDLRPLFAGIARVLRKEGLFLFTTLGPDSLAAIRQAWRGVDDHAHVNVFADMHDVGDALVAAGLADPVIDTDRLEVRYRSVDGLFRDLTGAGARNSLAGRRGTLTGREAFGRFRRRLEDRFPGGELTLGLELVYGHAWGAGPRPTPGEYRVDPAAIGVRRR